MMAKPASMTPFDTLAVCPGKIKLSRGFDDAIEFNQMQATRSLCFLGFSLLEDFEASKPAWPRLVKTAPGDIK